MKPRCHSDILLVLKILATIFMWPALIFLCVICVLMVNRFGLLDYLPTYVSVWMGLSFILLPGCIVLMWMWQWFKQRARIMVSATLACVLLAGWIGPVTYGVNRINYVKSLQITEQIDLALYEPFRQDTRAALLGAPSSLQFTAQNRPRLDGATAFYPVYAAFTRATYPQGEYKYDNYNSSVRCSRTEEAYWRLIYGDVDMIFAFGPSEGQQEEAEYNGVRLNLIPIGYEAFVFFVNDQNPIDNLSDWQIKQIYSGEAANWNQLGGNNEKIVPYQRNPNSGSQTALERIMGDTPIMNPPHGTVQSTMGGMIMQDYHNYPGAIGYTFRFYSTHMIGNPNIRLLSIDGVAPTRENIENRSYRYFMPFYAITLETPSQETQDLIDWILSEQGQELIEKTGYTGIGN